MSQNFEGSPKGLELAIVGNCSYSALINQRGSVVWSCFPRFDGDPVFCSLLRKNQDIGFFDIEVNKSESIQQYYLENTAVLRTKVTDSQGSCVEITDCAPRFKKFERIYRPNMLLRTIVPVCGRPRIRIRLRPTFGYGWGIPEKTRGSNHIRYLLPTMTLRLTTNAPVSYIVDEVLFEIEEPIQLLLMPDESLTEPIGDLSALYLKSTIDYWQEWIRSLSVPFEWQDQVIRAMITMKLSFFEETGAIIRAATTSIPFSPHKKGEQYTNMDWRYCFLEDAFAVTSTLREVGATSMMQDYLRFISNVVACYGTEDAIDELNWSTNPSNPGIEETLVATTGVSSFGSIFGIALETKLYEKEMHRLAGYRAMGPVVCGNKVSLESHMHVYGTVILALAQLFYDKRLSVRGDVTLFHRLEALAKRILTEMDHAAETSSIAAATGEPTPLKPGSSTYAHATIWGACDRLAKLAQKLKLSERHKYWCDSAAHVKKRVLEKALHPVTKDYFVATFGGTTIEPRLLLLPQFGFIEATDPLFLNTLAQIEKEYLKGKLIVVEDEWDGLHSLSRTGVPIPKPHSTSTAAAQTANTPVDAASSKSNETSVTKTARILHTLWYIRALARCNRKKEGRDIFEFVLSAANRCGIFSDSIDVHTGELWGNFPMTSVMGGILQCAQVLSKKWMEVL